ncbi:Metallo-dependent phosphatase-like protein [Bombardia bombarda]|uniref:Metallo-dependent phosphatase-like protein n=1 Tax=Bombardia bombarda TaxID=252184 RepID=A0AA39XBT1_9PEZI|nr:Metallo-dependent phosphatase-like protein [Bombardia bombarda]
MTTFSHTPSAPNPGSESVSTPEKSPNANANLIPTRILIISDTHGNEFPLPTSTDKPIDLVIHCGDITRGSRIAHLHAAIAALARIPTPLKLVIAGNHDFTLDTPVFRARLAELRAERAADPSLVPATPSLLDKYGDVGDARRVFESAAARAAGVRFLDEGVYDFVLARTGARLKVYASPYTPAFGTPGFQYTEEEGHDFAIPRGVDVVVSHGPPKGVLDRVPMNGARAGSAELFAAVARARPRLHCFGHIHEAWGAELVTWRDQDGDGDGDGEEGRGRRRGRGGGVVVDSLEEAIKRRKREREPSHLVDIDQERSVLVDSLEALRVWDDTDEALEASEEKLRRLDQYITDKCCMTSHCAGDANPLIQEKHTLFVNAAAQKKIGRAPWIVDIELPRAEVEGERCNGCNGHGNGHGNGNNGSSHENGHGSSEDNSHDNAHSNGSSRD